MDLLKYLSYKLENNEENLNKWPPPFGEEGHTTDQNAGFQSHDNKKYKKDRFNVNFRSN